jgi:hypothetical protein
MFGFISIVFVFTYIFRRMDLRGRKGGRTRGIRRSIGGFSQLLGIAIFGSQPPCSDNKTLPHVSAYCPSPAIIEQPSHYLWMIYLAGHCHNILAQTSTPLFNSNRTTVSYDAACRALGTILSSLGISICPFLQQQSNKRGMSLHSGTFHSSHMEASSMNSSFASIH